MRILQTALAVRLDGGIEKYHVVCQSSRSSSFWVCPDLFKCDFQEPFNPDGPSPEECGQWQASSQGKVNSSKNPEPQIHRRQTGRGKEKHTETVNNVAIDVTEMKTGRQSQLKWIFQDWLEKVWDRIGGKTQQEDFMFQVPTPFEY